jgi:hypothetical protein
VKNMSKWASCVAYGGGFDLCELDCVFLDVSHFMMVDEDGDEFGDSCSCRIAGADMFVI